MADFTSENDTEQGPAPLGDKGELFKDAMANGSAKNIFGQPADAAEGQRFDHSSISPRGYNGFKWTKGGRGLPYMLDGRLMNWALYHGTNAAAEALKLITNMLKEGDSTATATEFLHEGIHALRIIWHDESHELVCLVPADQNGKFPKFAFIDPNTNLAEIRPTQWVYKDFMARGRTSLTVAAPKVGKSLLAMHEAVDMATGGKVFNEQIEPMRVLYLNAEDTDDMLWARLAAICKLHNISLADMEGRLVLQSGVEFPEFFLLGFDEQTRQTVPNPEVIKALTKAVDHLDLDAIIIDPLQDLSHADETNEAFRTLGQMLRLFASTKDVAIHIIHHTRKVGVGLTPSIDDARGGSALRGTCRFNRVLVGMDKNEGVKAQVDDHRFFFRIGEVEATMAPPSSTANQWFEKTAVETPNGEWVGAIRQWQWPDQFEGVTVDMAMKVRKAVAEADPPYRKNHQAKNWVGNAVMQICGFAPLPDDTENILKAKKARATALVNKWLLTGVLKETTQKDPRSGKEHPIIVAGQNDPSEVENF
ncbi:AAA family ATPase [Shimia isoporae]|nr:AAA family ATPase [Shimia isoporae]